MHGKKLRGAWVLVVSALTVLGVAPAAAATPGHTPVVLFPAFRLTKLQVTVQDQTSVPGCPRSGAFLDWYQNDRPSTEFSQVCQDKLLTLAYDPNPAKPMASRFSEQPGVDVRVLDYGSTKSAPFYETLYKTLEANGYVRDKDIRVAGYDARLTPDIGGFVERAKKLVEDTYRDNGGRRVRLVGHSNGPLYAQYLLTHTSHAWRAKYIQGFTPIAGNLPGQGLLASVLFTGLNIQDFGYPKTPENAASSARMYLTAPSTYMSSSDPKVFGDREVMVRDESTGRDYTPRDYARLFTDAKLPQARALADYYVGFVKFTDRRWFPDVDVHAEKGSGVSTIVGAKLPDLTAGQVVGPATQFISRDGDGNQEDITNEATLVWRRMQCWTYELSDNPGVDHLSLPGNGNVLGRLVADLTDS